MKTKKAQLMVPLTFPKISNKVSISFKMVQFIKDNGKIDKGTVMVCKFGQMERVMKVNGMKIKRMGGVFFTMLMATSLMANGNMIKQMDSVLTITRTAANMKASGSMTYKKVKAKKPGKTNPHTKADIKKDKRMVRAFTFGQTEVSTMDSG